MTDLLDQLRDANPVDAQAVEVSARLRARVLQAAPTHPTPKRRRGISLAILATAVVACIAIWLAPGGRGGTPNLAARAYAATGGNGIVHWRTELRMYSNGKRIDHQRSEGWTHGGVTHVIRYDMRGHEARLSDEWRSARGRATVYIASSDDYLEVPAAKRAGADPLSDGDPFAIFRRAFRTGKLERLAPRRYRVDLPGNANDGISAIYDLDEQTALPTRFTLVSNVASRGKRYENKLVMRFSTYERLPLTQANRTRLRLLPHPGAGPKDDPASRHFAVLRGEGRPSSDALRAIERFARQATRFALDADGARTISAGHYLIPGHGYICLATAQQAGFGASCITIARAVRRGIASGTPGQRLTVAVPDGVTALRTRQRGGGTATVAVRNNGATLPPDTYEWRFVR
jgi:hypothetical protein